MSVSRDEMVRFCRNFLEVENFTDFCVNGLQVEGAAKITRIVTGVSLSEKLIEAAIERQAEMILVHHGFFAGGIPSPLALGGFNRTRLKLILSHDLNVVGFHLPLDAHPKIGNNVSIAKLLGAKQLQSFGVGFVGELAKPVEWKSFSTLVAEKLKTQVVAVGSPQGKVRRVAIVSGGASTEFEAAAFLGVDVLVCGDLREHVVRAAEEMHIGIVNAGHYNTEKLGVRNLGDLVAKRFKVPVEFVDIPCEI